MAAIRLPNLAAVLFLVLICNAVALSSPSPLRGYHFGASTSAAAPKKVSASSIGRRGPKSYVPDGLSEDQYRQIKSEELARQQKMNFGMWGPRFKQIDGDPDSNWFNLPSLWTSGFSAENKARRPGEKSVDTAGFASLAILYLRRYGLAYLMLLLSTQMMVRSLLAGEKALSVKWLAFRTILPLLALKPTRIIAATLGQKRRLGWLSRGGTAKLAGLVAVLTSGIAYVLR
ncbi:hypothetical protein ACHAXT_005206 [Thalassiosira profunda]